MGKVSTILAIFLILVGHAFTSLANEQATGESDSYLWLPGKLIPNEFALSDGTWPKSSIRECIKKCSENKFCSGFSIEKVYGDAWQSGCKGNVCEQKTECHAKGSRSANELWLPSDKQIRVPKVDPNSNAWIEGWGTILKSKP